MTKYLINENIHGYDKISVNDIDKANSLNSLFVVIIDKSCDSEVAKYYKFINKALKNNNRVITVGVNDENVAFKPIASMMTTFNSYDIYQVDGREYISANYLLTLEDREPDMAEVQAYIGGDVIAYSDMSTILFGIESLVEEGNIEGLKNYVEDRMLSIEKLTVTLNNMKKTCDVFNSNELIDAVNSLKEKEKKLSDTIGDKDKTIEEIKFDRDQKKVDLENLKRENERLKNRNNDLKAQTESGSSIIRSYKEIHTQSINCRTKFVLYFKEISYVKYTNSLMLQLIKAIKLRNPNLKIKFIIYDTSSELYQVYNPLRIVSGSEYVANKTSIINKVETFVVSEANPTILQDILVSEQCFDVVVIYDRIKGITDLVNGNNVTKFFVINSSTDYEKLKAILKINDTSFILTNASSTLGKTKETGTAVKAKVREFLDIPTIDGYTTTTDSSKTSKYMKLATEFTKVPLIETIIKKSRINTL